MSTLTLEVVAIDDTVPGIRTLTLARADRGVLPSFTPGSHIVIQCADGANAYSLTGETTSPREYVVSVLECPQGRGGSRWIHRDLTVGATLVAHQPRSAFAPVLRASRHLLIAAGIGITPMVSHLRSARRWGRDVRLLYVHRQGGGAYVDEIGSLTDERARSSPTARPSCPSCRRHWPANRSARMSTSAAQANSSTTSSPPPPGWAGRPAASTSSTSAATWRPGIRSKSSCPAAVMFSPSSQESRCWRH